MVLVVRSVLEKGHGQVLDLKTKCPDVAKSGIMKKMK